MIDSIERLCEVQRNDGSKTTIVESTKYDITTICHCAMRSTKTRLTGGKDIKI